LEADRIAALADVISSPADADPTPKDGAILRFGTVTAVGTGADAGKVKCDFGGVAWLRVDSHLPSVTVGQRVYAFMQNGTAVVTGSLDPDPTSTDFALPVTASTSAAPEASVTIGAIGPFSTPAIQFGTGAGIYSAGDDIGIAGDSLQVARVVASPGTVAQTSIGATTIFGAAGVGLGTANDAGIVRTGPGSTGIIGSATTPGDVTAQNADTNRKVRVGAVGAFLVAGITFSNAEDTGLYRAGPGNTGVFGKLTTGNLQHNGDGVGFYGTDAVTQQHYTTGFIGSRSRDLTVSLGDVAGVASVVRAIVDDLIRLGLFGD
jgi:hypothetical protein